jgi:hypothetical protein
MRKIKPDVPGIIAGTILAGGASIWFLNDIDVVRTDDIGLNAALLLVAAGIVGLAASHRG